MVRYCAISDERAGATGLEPAASCGTGRRSKQTSSKIMPLSCVSEGENYRWLKVCLVRKPDSVCAGVR